MEQKIGTLAQDVNCPRNFVINIPSKEMIKVCVLEKNKFLEVVNVRNYKKKESKFVARKSFPIFIRRYC